MVFRIAREVGNDAQQRSLADPPVAIKDDMELLIFDQVDKLLEKPPPAGEAGADRGPGYVFWWVRWRQRLRVS